MSEAQMTRDVTKARGFFIFPSGDSRCMAPAERETVMTEIKRVFTG
jgi:hypothetical protein